MRNNSARRAAAPAPNRTTIRTAAVAVTALACLTAAACSSSSSSSTSASGTSTSASASSNPLTPSTSGTVVVGSANFPEDELIAQIYVDALQGKGIKVTSKFNIGAREVYYPEIEKGAITIIPDYNGALLTTSVDPTSTAASTAAVNAALTAKLPSTLEILNSAAAQDKDSITVTQATATKYHLTSISDLASVAKSFVIGGPSEFQTRADGVPGLKKIYGLTFKSFQPLDESGPITLTALLGGKVQAADVFTTTPQIITDHFVSLADPKNLFAAQNVTPLVYKKGVNSTIVSTLNAVSAVLTTNALLQMDKALIIDHASYTQVASGFLSQEGLK
ncbi:MAG: ABC transporter substrate-binding protein [Streptosporangiaceae bacterium]|jgi:osmoprotectant transport system substrate-binding protein